MVNISFSDLSDPPDVRSQGRADTIEVHYIALSTTTVRLILMLTGMWVIGRHDRKTFLFCLLCEEGYCESGTPNWLMCGGCSDLRDLRLGFKVVKVNVNV